MLFVNSPTSLSNFWKQTLDIRRSISRKLANIDLSESAATFVHSPLKSPMDCSGSGLGPTLNMKGSWANHSLQSDPELVDRPLSSTVISSASNISTSYGSRLTLLIMLIIIAIIINI